MDAFDEEQQAFNRSPLDDENLLSGQFCLVDAIAKATRRTRT